MTNRQTLTRAIEEITERRKMLEARLDAANKIESPTTRKEATLATHHAILGLDDALSAVRILMLSFPQDADVPQDVEVAAPAEAPATNAVPQVTQP